MTAYLKILRPHQWLKNLMLFFPPFLGGVLFNSGFFSKGLLPFAVFCIASSTTYISGAAVVLACEQAAERIRIRAARMLSGLAL